MQVESLHSELISHNRCRGPPPQRSLPGPLEVNFQALESNLATLPWVRTNRRSSRSVVGRLKLTSAGVLPSLESPSPSPACEASQHPIRPPSARLTMRGQLGGSCERLSPFPQGESMSLRDRYRSTHASTLMPPTTLLV